MANHPKVTVFGYDPGRDKIDCMVGNDHMAIPITIKGSRTPAAGETIKGPSLWIRSSLSPYYAFPFMYGGLVSSATDTVITLVNAADAAHFKASDKVSFFDLSAGGFSGGTAGIVTSVDEAAGTVTLSGAGLSGSVPAAGDICFVCSGAGTNGWIGDGSRTYEKNVCIVLEDIVMVKDMDQLSAGYIQGTFLRSKILNATHCPSGSVETARVNTLSVSNTQLLNLIDIVT